MTPSAGISQNHTYRVGWRGTHNRTFCLRMATNKRSGRNLMAKDEFKNLGFGDDKPTEDTKKDDGADKGQKGELRW